MEETPLADDAKRQLSLKLNFGKGSSEQLEPVRVDAFEGLSEHFMVVIEVLALAEIELLPNLGLPASIRVENDGEFCRYFHGIVIDSCFLREIEQQGFLYQLTLAPSAHFHEQGSGYRIYQGKTVIEIIKSVLERCKIDFEVRITSGNRKLPYCVQYGESDFAFICRLMEEEGLYYYYQHEAGAHVMIICDRPGSHSELSPGTFTYNIHSGAVAISDSRLRDLSELTFIQAWQERASSGAEARVTFRDYDFKNPAAPVESISADRQSHTEDSVEVYRWPGRHYDTGDGKALASVLLESRRAQRLRYEARSQFPGIQTGHLFSLASHPNGRFNRKYLIVNCRTHLANEIYRSGMAGGETSTEFTAIQDDVQFRAPIVTPRPTAKGPETAVIVGPCDEEIHVDEYGRVKVQFHWDREGKKDDNSSCWIRVSQTGGLGNIIIPRVGHEVLVDFINGNPDRPIVVGRVFNAANMPEYALPQHKTRVLWRTKTYKRDSGCEIPGAKPLDSGKPGANELRFEDATAKEEIYLHAEKDMNTRIRDSETHHVGNNVDIMVGNNRTEAVGIDETITIGNNRTESVGKNEAVTVGKNRNVNIGDSDTLGVSKHMTVDVGKTIHISAGDKITIEVGNSSITIDPLSIKAIAKFISLKSSGKAEVQATDTTIKGSASLTAQGGIVKIN
ncbi:type VI secretion system Vgr family protein [Novosphingobium album (ex Liu et al. 2023)]|uniref:Type VI secretion system tip protein TssI/VgrG n=1 Tax=Novosphingobium album (ex Liu et al. 2023) TaxID=3031130 RepID=A0ABT5WV22_9SPHN|nr:type VI secretion system tip protein TssI/VgrG [Novosphingobium album (ex Liu et al. 2023)]MDE8653707.1 type VI secretion system tip protein TssI/VgrG [Novosphingobium album (ex Liu et al. 2023)]